MNDKKKENQCSSKILSRNSLNSKFALAGISPQTGNVLCLLLRIYLMSITE